MYIETWSQFVNKKHLIDEAVKLAVVFFEYGKIRSEIFGCRRMFVTEMLADRRRGVSMFVHVLMSVHLEITSSISILHGHEEFKCRE